MSDLTVADELAVEALSHEMRALIDRLIAAAIEQRDDANYSAGYLDGCSIGSAEGFLRGVAVGRKDPRRTTERDA